MSRIRLNRPFVWLNVTQFLGAFNDNVFKLLVIFFLVPLLGEQSRVQVVATASAVFVAPFLLFAHTAGVLADRLSKRNIIVFAKALEVAVMLLGCGAILRESPLGLYGVIFLMSAQSALFGPCKYGIVPELVSAEQLSRANSLLVGCSYLAIILGTFIPSFLLLVVLNRSHLGLALFCVVVATAGLLASLRIQRTEPAGGTKRFSVLFPVEIFRTLRETARDRYLLAAVLGGGYFLFLAGFIQQNVLLYGREYLGLGLIESGYLFPMAAMGIAMGALLAGVLSGRNIEFGIVPMGAMGLTLTTLGLGFAPPSVPTVLALSFLVGISSGLFIVPLNTFVQYRSPRRSRGQILACTSFLGFSGVALSAGLLVLLTDVMGLAANECFVVVGALTGVLAVATVRLLPDFLVRFVVVLITRIVYRIRVDGLRHLPMDGPALLVPNHVTYVDALLISACTQRRIRFMMAREIYERSRLRPVFRLMGVIPVSRNDPPRRILAALHEARAALRAGYLVCIFAEGALTRNGNMLAFRPGLERIVKGTDAPIIPVYIGGAWGSIFSHASGRVFRTVPRHVPYPVSILLGPPMPPTVSTWDVRQAVVHLSTRAFDLSPDAKHALPVRFVKAARARWRRRAVADTTGRELSYGRLLTAAVILGERLERITAGQEMVGVLLPASVAGVVANTALSLSGRVPVNLNFTSSREAMASAIRQCDLRTVISSRAFVQKMESLELPEGTVFVEDLLAGISTRERVAGLLRAALVPANRLARFRRPGPDDLATVMFSSGSSGEPKGVMLSHRNVLSNIASFATVFRMTRTDSLCGVLPFFHAFGFTVTLWFPLLEGFPVCYHPNPLDISRVVGMIREHRLTTLVATPTFLLGYWRRAKAEDFASLRTVIVGAEKLKRRIAQAFRDKFGIEPLEGYGATELAPVVALNIRNAALEKAEGPAVKAGSVGQAIPGVAVRVVAPDSGEVRPVGEDGELHVKGPNVMLGYLGRADKTAEVVKDGWYATGDIASLDEEGFIFLKDRLSRYSKIAGEMVPHLAVEERLTDALGAVEPVLAVTGVADERRGERLVVLFTDAAGDADTLAAIARDCPLPNLWKPRREDFFRIERLPVLGSGKLDLRSIRKMAQDLAGGRR